MLLLTAYGTQAGLGQVLKLMGKINGETSLFMLQKVPHTCFIKKELGTSFTWVERQDVPSGW